MKRNVLDRTQLQMHLYGVLRYRDLWSLGVRGSDLFYLTYIGGVRSIGEGLYVRSDLDPPTAFLAARRINHGTLCLLSALNVYGFLDRAPEKVWVAIPHTQRRPLPVIAPLEVVRVRRKLLASGSTLERMGGVRVLITTPVRTVVDCVRFRRRIGIDLARSVLRDVLDSGAMSSDELLQEARRCRVSKTMRAELARIRPELGVIFREERRDRRNERSKRAPPAG